MAEEALTEAHIRAEQARDRQGDAREAAAQVERRRWLAARARAMTDELLREAAEATGDGR